LGSCGQGFLKHPWASAGKNLTFLKKPRYVGPSPEKHRPRVDQGWRCPHIFPTRKSLCCRGGLPRQTISRQCIDFKKTPRGDRCGAARCSGPRRGPLMDPTQTLGDRRHSRGPRALGDPESRVSIPKIQLKDYAIGIPMPRHRPYLRLILHMSLSARVALKELR